ncbi:hypothetical protein [Heyndrickxia camelliae]|uniref:Uncharacterized protein n=1 Tax=Heyndrickxia camelliae TaxID=1707093 RepID=A0A2N3LMC6_9BACI|nr:hypothetical protein [Heyndrickxia camelliae]PKR85699.1 hypothetical protein CWO92_08300 [Heyndrickxia camelliae]
MRFGAITRPGDTLTCYGNVKHVYEKDNKRLVEFDLFAEKAPEELVGSGTAILTFHGMKKGGNLWRI